MWYEIIPSFLIITVAVAAPHYLTGPFNWLLCGHYYRRSMLDKYEALQYLRDKRLIDPYKLFGLENIPDEEETEELNPDSNAEETMKQRMELRKKRKKSTKKIVTKKRVKVQFVENSQ
ncbi:uncharacterized protein LOC123015519 [Tribolium madens]|uniref:uncharacterized protein LOC123015519 n=1 Tax=Tribolium madens TaxID=41895 RepID=UPI001CF746F7|nr:uncharacterized protein LOC123015519 [Tribolium madens]